MSTTTPTPAQPAEQGEALKPCPFCGGTADFESPDRYRHLVSCSNEECPVIINVYGETYEQAVSRWNTRADESRLAEAQGLIREMLAKLEYLAKHRLWTPSRKSQSLLQRAKQALEVWG